MSEATIFRPETPDQAAEAVRWALSHRAPLEIVGGGSRRGFGRPVAAAHRLDAGALAGVLSYEPEELVLTARPGTPLAEIRALLAGRGQHLAFEPPDLAPLWGGAAGAGTLGGLIATGMAGPRRIKDGSARDHTLGIAGVNGRGELFKAGAKVVKNVTGYDLPKLLAGSFGTLAVLTEITVKVLPAPETVATLVLTGHTEESAIRALTLALQSPYEVSGAALLPQPVAARSTVPAVAAAGGPLALVRLDGVAPSVAARVRALTDEIGADATLDHEPSVALWREIRDVSCFAGTDTLLWKVSVPPAEGARVAAAIRARLEADILFDWGGGLLWVSTRSEESADVVRGAVGGSGHATLVRAPEAVRAAVPVFHPEPPPLAALSARVKQSFDPAGILNPGRMHPGV